MIDINYDIFITYLSESELYARLLELELKGRGNKIFLDFLEPEKWADATVEIAKITPVFIVVLPLQHLTEVDYSVVQEKVSLIEKCQNHIVFIRPTNGLNVNDTSDISPNVVDLVGEIKIVNIAFERSRVSSLTHDVDNLARDHISPFLNPSQKMVFISYSRKDTEVADKICNAFDKVGITYFIDRKGIGGGLEFPYVIAQAIKECKIFLFLASKNAYQSSFTNKEITYAFNKKKNMLPYIIDSSALPDELDFVFSSINRRILKEHPIEPILINDILNLLDRMSTQQSFEKPKETRKEELTLSFFNSHRKACIISLSILSLLMVILITPLTSLFHAPRPDNFKFKKPDSTNLYLKNGENDIQGVDLGLPSGTIWADRNMGAESINNYGDFYAWGDSTTRTSYSEGQYKNGKIIGASIAKTSYDIAFVKSNKEWWMPSEEQFEELILHCKWRWFNMNGFCGFIVTGKNGNSIKLPASGWMCSTAIEYQSSFGYYWTADAEIGKTGFAKELLFGKGYIKMGRGYVYYGRSIRPVKKLSD